jgi:hypothetical protein
MRFGKLRIDPSRDVTGSGKLGEGLDHREFLRGLRRRRDKRHFSACRHSGSVEIADLDVWILEHKAVGPIHDKIVHVDDAAASNQLKIHDYRARGIAGGEGRDLATVEGDQARSAHHSVRLRIAFGSSHHLRF